MRELPVPALPDLGQMITQGNTGDAPPDNALLTALLSQHKAPLCSVITQDNNTVMQQGHNGMDNAPITDDTIRKWAREGRSKRKIAEHLTGAMQTRLARIDRALAADTPPGAFRFLSDENEGGNHVD
jgi:hypothetical protein